MNRFLAGACAVSVLAAAYAAHAISDTDSTSSKLTIHGTVNPYCTIVTVARYAPILALAKSLTAYSGVSTDYDYKLRSASPTLMEPATNVAGIL